MKSPAALLGYFLLCSIGILIHSNAYGQELYTARGYWIESTKETYQKIKEKEQTGDVLTDNEQLYLEDYEAYLASYYQRLSDAEKELYQQKKNEWERELLAPQAPAVAQEEFEWRGRDRFISGFYGALYGTSFVVIAEIDNVAAAGIPLITGGLWVLGPLINPKKYENITRPVLRASNTGKLLGLLYGASLGVLIGGDSDNTAKLALGFSTIGSIAMGEIGFHLQKKNNYSEGHIELVRHYGLVGPWLGVAGVISTSPENVNVFGAAALAGGAVGLIAGHKVSKRYDYTKGDVDNIKTLTWISTGLGVTAVASAVSNSGTTALILIPAVGTVIGTALGQRAVKGVYLSKKQGSTISYSSGGAALLGLGLATVIGTESASAWVGIPSALALLTQQILFNKYKRVNLTDRLQKGHTGIAKGLIFSMKVTPENYFINKHLPVNGMGEGVNPNLALPNPLVSMKLSF